MMRTRARYLTGRLIGISLALTTIDVAAQTLFHRVDQIATHAIDERRWHLTAGYHAITVAGDGDTDLDCYAFDASGTLLAKDDDPTDRCVLGWVQRQPGPVLLRIVNIGRVYNVYELSVY